MNRTQIILSGLAVVLIIFLYNLPKYVVDNEKLETADQITRSNQTQGEGFHEIEVSEDIRYTINSLNTLVYGEFSDNSLNFADSLAGIYLRIGQTDSAVAIAKYLRQKSDREFAYAAANIYFKVFNFATEREQAQEYGTVAREIYSQLLEEDADNLDIKTKIALTYIPGENPMQGILMLREILEKDPQNWDAIFNLGLLSIQSGQYDRAVERFAKLIEMRPNDLQANFYLGLSYFELDQNEQAKRYFLKVKQLGADPAIIATVERYLNDIENL